MGGSSGLIWEIREHRASEDSALKFSGSTTSDRRDSLEGPCQGASAGARSNHATASPEQIDSAPGESLRGTNRESDEALIDRIRGGERAAFDEIYERYFKRVYAFLDKRLRNRADTEETTQEVFINIFSSLDSFRGDAPFAAWTFGVTRRTLAARFRRKRHPTVPLYEKDDEQSLSTLSAGASAEATPLRVLENEITDEQRMLFEMHHIHALPIAEIAETLSKSEDSVKSNLYRTRKLLLR